MRGILEPRLARSASQGLPRCSIKQMKHPWQYDEAAQVGTDYRNRTQAAAYDGLMRKLRNSEAEAGDIRQALALTARSTLWEIGTGTGECALALAAAVRHVYATDVSPAMLEIARRKAAARSVKNVTFAEGGFLSGFRPARPVDGIITQLALHHLPDFWKSRALAAIARRLRSGGRLYLRDVVFPAATKDYDQFFNATVKGVRQRAGDKAARQTIEHIKAEFSTLDWILEGMIRRSGLKMLNKKNEGFISIYVCGK